MGGRGGTSPASTSLQKLIDKYGHLVSDKDRIIIENNFLKERIKYLQEKDFLTNEEYKEYDYLIEQGQGYVGTNNYHHIQHYLRDEEGFQRNIESNFRRTAKDIKKNVINTVKKLDKNMVALKQGITTYRYSDANAIENIPGLKGDNFRDKMLYLSERLKTSSFRVPAEKGFLSVSTDKNKNLFKDRPLFITVKAPKGIKAYISKNHLESEVVFARGTSYDITKVGLDRNGWNMEIVLRKGK